MELSLQTWIAIQLLISKKVPVAQLWYMVPAMLRSGFNPQGNTYNTYNT